MDVIPQFFQSVIAIELAVTGALLWQIRYFEHGSGTSARDEQHLPDARIRLLIAVILAATLFGSLWALIHQAGRWAAIAVTIGLAISLVPILLRVLPPLARDPGTEARDPRSTVTIVGLIVYVVVVAAFVILLSG